MEIKTKFNLGDVVSKIGEAYPRTIISIEVHIDENGRQSICHHLKVPNGNVRAYIAREQDLELI